MHSDLMLRPWTKLAVLALACSTLLTTAAAQKGKDLMRTMRKTTDQALAALSGDVQANDRASCADLGITLFALVGNGSTKDRGPHREEVGKLADRMLARQWDDGSFYDGASKGPCTPGLEQALATLGLVEFAAASRDAELRSAAERALARVSKWVRDDGTCTVSYSPDEPADFDTTAWAALALAAAKAARIGTHDEEQLDRMCTWLSEHVGDEPTPPYRKHRPTLDAAGRIAIVRLAHRMAGRDPAETDLPGVEDLLPAGKPKATSQQNATTFALGALETYQNGGDPWRQLTPFVLATIEGIEQGKLDTFDKNTAERALRIVGAQVYWRYGPLLRRK